MHFFSASHCIPHTAGHKQKEPSVKTLRSPLPADFWRHCVLILEGLRVEWQNSTPSFASTPERRNGNINLSKYFISSSGDRIQNQSVLQSHFMPLRHDWPQQCLYCIKLNIVSRTYKVGRGNLGTLRQDTPLPFRHIRTPVYLYPVYLLPYSGDIYVINETTALK